MQKYKITFKNGEYVTLNYETLTGATKYACYLLGVDQSEVVKAEKVAL